MILEKRGENRRCTGMKRRGESEKEEGGDHAPPSARACVCTNGAGAGSGGTDGRGHKESGGGRRSSSRERFHSGSRMHEGRERKVSSVGASDKHTHEREAEAGLSKVMPVSENRDTCTSAADEDAVVSPPYPGRSTSRGRSVDCEA